MSYILREECCNNASRQRGNSSTRSATEHQISGDRRVAINAGSHHHVHSSINNIPSQRSPSGIFSEILPIRDKIEIAASDLNDGKITDI